MDYRDIATLIMDQGNGTHAFERAAEVARDAARREPDKAAGFFLLGWEALEFVNVFERMPVTEASALAAQKRLAEHAERLDAAGNDKAGVLEILNDMANKFCAEQ